MSQQLISAIQEGKTSLVRKALSDNSNLDISSVLDDVTGDTALHLVAKNSANLICMIVMKEVEQ